MTMTNMAAVARRSRASLNLLLKLLVLILFSTTIKRLLQDNSSIKSDNSKFHLGKELAMP